MSKASLKFRTDSLHGDMPTSRTECILGLNSRIENRSCTGHSDVVPPTNVRYEYGPLRAYIQNRDIQFGFEIDLDAGVYTAWRAGEYGSPVWFKSQSAKPLERSGSTVHSHTATVDTGERKTIFGYTARRVVIKYASKRDSELASESESDGWYINAPVAWLNLHPPLKGNAVFHIAGPEEDDFKFTEIGERETGFPLFEARTTRSYFRDQEGVLRSHETSQRDKVTEFSEAALDPGLFIPPCGFRRVMQLPGGFRYSLSDRLRFRWEMLKDSHSLRGKLALSG